jgi:uncharacterized protein
METRMKHLFKQFSVLVFFVVTVGQLAAQPANGPRAYSERFYAKETIEISMRDGIKLTTEILKPRWTTDRLPIFMIRTPYGTGHVGFNDPARMQKLAEDGYIFVLQEMRGTQRSGGAFALIPPRSRGTNAGKSDEANDAFDTVDWLIKNVSNNNGAVGVAGCSYPGYAAVMAGLSAHPAIKAISPQAAMADPFRGDDFYWNGIPFLAVAPFFATEMESREKSQARLDSADAYEWYLKAGALKDVHAAAFDQPSPLWQEMLRDSSLTKFWQQRVLANEAANFKVPALHVMGWFDAEDFPGPIRLFQAVDALDRNGSQRAIIGPWNHCRWNRAGPGDRIGPLHFSDATADQFKQIEADFFAYYLKNRGSLTQMPQVQLFETGRGGGWRSAEHWPARIEPTSIQHWHLSADEQLSATLPTESGQDSYRSDPNKPVPHAPRPSGFFVGIELIPSDFNNRVLFLLADQRFVHGRPDVMTWTSEPLAQDTVLDGQAVLEFFAATTGTDVDWIVQLVDVHPDNFDPVMSGYRVPVSRGALRASLRNDLSKPVAVVPDQIEKYTIALEARRHRFGRGHRVLLQLQSTYFPMLARNPQKFIPAEQATREDFALVTNTIYRGGDKPSTLHLPLSTSHH